MGDGSDSPLLVFDLLEYTSVTAEDNSLGE